MSEEIKRIVANFVGEYCCRLSGANEALVDIIQTQVEAERERCARVAEDLVGKEHWINSSNALPIVLTSKQIGTAIRNKPTNQQRRVK